MKLLLKAGRIIDPSQELDAQMDILIEDSRIAKIGKKIPDRYSDSKKGSDKDFKVINLDGMIVIPGLIDIHTHLREPGFEYKETIQSGCEAASAGGFTSIACMPNTNPVNDNRSVTEFIRRKASQSNLVNLYPVAALSKGSEGANLTDFLDLKDAEAIAFSDDGKSVMNSSLMRRALEYASSIDMPVITHCEDTYLSMGGSMNEGLVATELGIEGIPSMAEDVMVVRDAIIAGFTKTAVHIAHVSTAGSVQLIRDAKRRGIKVTAETAPHYFSLTEEALREFDTCAKVNPPLRTAEDVKAVKEGLRDGTIDVIASDHAPHAVTEKDVEFDRAASGMIGLETSLALSMKLVSEGVLTVSQLIQKMSTNPAKILKIPKGTLRVGADADITVLDMEKEWIVDRGKFRSKSRNSPFHGWKMKGKAVMTIVAGEVKYNESQNKP